MKKVNFRGAHTKIRSKRIRIIQYQVDPYLDACSSQRSGMAHFSVIHPPPKLSLKVAEY